MTVWYSADLHLGHTNIIRYCQRPFASVEEMNETLIERWNERVAPDDRVFVLGDVALGTISETLSLCARLNGHKTLICGNHDRPWPGNKGSAERLARWERRYRDEGGFRDVSTAATRDIGGTRVRLSHFPYRGDSHDADRFVQWRPTDDGGWLLHGHVHEKWRVNGRQINVGVDVWNYAPVAEATLAELIR